MQNNRGYAPGLACVKYNQKLAFHLRDMIHSTIFPATQLVPRPIIIPIMICKDAMHASVKQAYTEAFTTTKRQATLRQVRLVSRKCFRSTNP